MTTPKKKKSNLAQSFDELDETPTNDAHDDAKLETARALNSSLDYDNDLTLSLDQSDKGNINFWINWYDQFYF